jgi:hypothetical protein
MRQPSGSKKVIDFHLSGKIPVCRIALHIEKHPKRRLL